MLVPAPSRPDPAAVEPELAATRIRLNGWVGAATGVVSTVGTALAWGEPNFPALLGLWVGLSVAGGVLGAQWRRPDADVSRLMWLSTAVFLPLCSAMVILAGGLESILWVLIPLGCMTSAFAQQRSAWMTAALTTAAMATSMLAPLWLTNQPLAPALAEVAVRCAGFAFVWFLAHQIFEGQSEAADARLRSERRERAMVVETAHLRERAREQQKMEALGRLAGGVAHEFNNLLTVMAGAVDEVLAGRDPRLPPPDAVQDLSTAVFQARTLTRHLLDFSHSGVAEKQTLDLRQMLTESQRILQLTLGSSIRLVLSLPDAPLTIRCERHELLRVFVNLAANAREAMDEGGTFQITAGTHPDGAQAVQGGHASDPEFVVLNLSDTGRGMAASVQERVFEPFFTTKGPGGSGLGLTTAYSILAKHDGGISIASEEGVGTTVAIRLPWRAATEDAVRQSDGPDATASGSDGPQPQAPEPANLALARRPTLVLVDDEAMVLRTLKRLLRRAPFEITTYGQPEAFLADVRDGLQYDVLVTDINMPVLSGVDLVRCLEADGVVRPTLFVSGFSPENLDLSEFEGSGYAFLPKPFDGSTLREAVDRCVAQAS